MFDDDFWGILAFVGLGVSAYCAGQEKGKQKMIAQYEAQALIQSQQDQIDRLNARLNALNVNNIS